MAWNSRMPEAPLRGQSKGPIDGFESESLCRPNNESSLEPHLR